MNWTRFYQKRVNSTYQEYFEKKYQPFLKAIVKSQPKLVREEGIGIGSVSKFLRKSSIRSHGFDNNKTMIKLCRRNVPGVFTYLDCILNPAFYSEGDLVVTHGVLEHFSDNQIEKIIKRHKEEGIKGIHYVPTDRYTEQSFGDERLLSPFHWRDLVEPKKIILFNEDKDLVLIT
jgi:hypothetical protein